MVKGLSAWFHRILPWIDSNFWQFPKTCLRILNRLVKPYKNWFYHTHFCVPHIYAICIHTLSISIISIFDRNPNFSFNLQVQIDDDWWCWQWWTWWWCWQCWPWWPMVIDHDMFCQLLTRLISWFSMSNSPFLLTYRWHGYLLSSILDISIYIYGYIYIWIYW